MAWIDCAGKGSPSWAVAVEDEVFIVINQPESSDESEVYMSLNEGLLDPESPDYVHLREPTEAEKKTRSTSSNNEVMHALHLPARYQRKLKLKQIKLPGT
ncbi:uncharacterized protein [Vicugna pacos]|uniref:Uncharacterized protein isoform X2 n=1 Tax=Vicugna pacos TaxID=30538 RepID=A0ABM5DM53_VICPA